MIQTTPAPDADSPGAAHSTSALATQAQIAAELHDLAEVLRPDNEAYFCGQLRRVASLAMEPDARALFEPSLASFAAIAISEGEAMALHALLAIMPEPVFSARAGLFFLGSINADAPACFDLLAEKASPRGLMAKGKTLLSCAAESDSPRMVKRLLPLVDVLQLNDDGSDALFCAVAHADSEIAGLLAAHCPLRPLDNGKDALDEAVENCYWATVDAMSPFVPASRLAQIEASARGDLEEHFPVVMPTLNARWEQEQLLGVCRQAEESAPSTAKESDWPGRPQPRKDSRRI